MPDRREPERPDDDEGLSNLAQGYRGAAPYIAASTQLVASVAVFTLVGWWLDGKLGHETPWLLLVGAAVGMTGGFIGFFKTVMTKNKRSSGQ